MILVLTILLLAAIAVMMMMLAWLTVLHTGNSGWADTVWSATVGMVGVTAALVALGPGEPTPRALIVAAVVAAWSIRLAAHIGRRTLAGADDPRYAQLRKEWGEAAYPRQLLLFLQIQAAAAFILGLAVLAAAHNPAPLGLGDALGALIAVVALVGEAVADRQLRQFKANPANKGSVCNTGLWSLSRHPNYFFEWLFWLALVPVALGYGWGLVALAAPAMMYALLAHISGVPPLEAHMLRSRGEAYRRYQQRVRAFWPIPRSAST